MRKTIEWVQMTTLAVAFFVSASFVQAAGDFTGNGKADLVMYDPQTTSWFIESLAGTEIVDGLVFGGIGALPLTGDFNGDGIHDLAVYYPDTASWDMIEINGDPIASNVIWGAAVAIPLVGDFNGDGTDDIGYYEPPTGAWSIREVGGGLIVNGASMVANGVPVVGDFNNDGSQDMGVYTDNNGLWYLRSVGGPNIIWGQGWGFSGTIPLAGDFNGDGIDDMAIYVPDTGLWHVRHVAGNVLVMNLTTPAPPGAKPIVADFDGDGADDFVGVEGKPSNAWNIRSLSDSFTESDAQISGAPNSAVPVGVMYRAGDLNYSSTTTRNDFNGDGASDMAVYFPPTGEWFIRTLGGDQLAMFRGWGFSSALPVPADYNGNGLTDLAVYDPNTGNWYVVGMDQQIILFGANWGFPGAVPVPGDYDGDGIADLGVYDKNTGAWYVWSLAESAPIYWAEPWGWPGEVRPWENPPTSTVIPMPFDYDNDGITDLAVYYRGVSMPTSVWYIRGSGGQNWFPADAWGSSSSIGAPGRYVDFNDPRWPMGVSAYRIAAPGFNAEWNTPFAGGLAPTEGIFIGQYGRTLPVPGLDLDDNDSDDLVVYDYLNGNWTIMLSTGSGSALVNQPKNTINWGFNGAIPADIYSTIYKTSNYSIAPW